MWLSVNIVGTPVNGRPSIYSIDSVYQMELIFPTLCWSTKLLSSWFLIN
jgi:hypothetical protein